mmetsp:Transcript_103979/g.335273  ORF Transcript_103979/g.335273 Transcript_103979/m.335273 type:complete len:204 (+) Transcript_103979:2051-2662(+)
MQAMTAQQAARQRVPRSWAQTRSTGSRKSATQIISRPRKNARTIDSPRGKSMGRAHSSARATDPRPMIRSSNPSANTLDKLSSPALLRLDRLFVDASCPLPLRLALFWWTATTTASIKLTVASNHKPTVTAHSMGDDVLSTVLCCSPLGPASIQFGRGSQSSSISCWRTSQDPPELSLSHATFQGSALRRTPPVPRGTCQPPP